MKSCLGKVPFLINVLTLLMGKASFLLTFRVKLYEDVSYHKYIWF